MPTTDAVLLDTHCILWWQAGAARLSPGALSTVESARRLLVSPLSCWEVAMLAGKGRISLDRPTTTWVTDLLAGPRLELAELTPLIAVAAAELDGMHGDPVDRLLYATARTLHIPLVSKDRLIHDFAAARGDVSVVW